MARNKLSNKLDILDFNDAEDASEEMMAGLMTGMIDASNEQMKLALKHTKLIIQNNASGNMNEDKFSAVDNLF